MRRHILLASMAWIAPIGLAPLVSCTTAQDSGLVTLVTGGESTAAVFSAAPAPVTLRVDAVTWPDGGAAQSSTTIATSPVTASTFDLGSQPESPLTVLTVTGLAGDDAGDQPVMFGASLPMFLGNLNGYDLNLFVQRTGELARMTDAGAIDTRTAPTMSVIEGQYVFIGGGNESASELTTQLLDLLDQSWVSSAPTLPVVPRSVVFNDVIGWLFDEASAAYYDFSGATSSTTILLPSGGSSADVAGGATLTDSNGVFYVVGPTRQSAPSDLVLRVDTGNTSETYPYGTPTWMTLSAPRLGASAVWMAAYGLVVIGGNTTEDGAGVEVIGPGASIGSPNALFPADSTTGAGAAVLDAQHVLLAGGMTNGWGTDGGGADGGDGEAGSANPGGVDAGIRVLNLACADSCAPAQCLASLSSALVTAQAFDIDSANAVAVGDDITGLTHVFTITSPDAWQTCSATEVPTRVAHTQARVVLSPSSLVVPGSFLLFGGSPGGEIESFVPEVATY
jgi:hypothetical protein